jgi:DNA-binding transcriptional regulator GbsR (MarR family)
MAVTTKSVAIQLLEERVQALESELEEKDSELETANDRLTQIYALTSDIGEETEDEDLDEFEEIDE